MSADIIVITADEFLTKFVQETLFLTHVKEEEPEITKKSAEIEETDSVQTIISGEYFCPKLLV